MTTYTEKHRESYERRKVSELQRMKTYYAQNAERLRANRRARYAAKKAAKNPEPEVLSAP
jgi:hypothetical protein